jgi:hypothetical protein
MNTPDFSYWLPNNYEPVPLTLILSSLFIGIVIASLAALYHQLFLGGIVRRIIEKDALSPDKALTIEELGYKKSNIFIKFALRQKSTFRKTVLCREDDPKRFYIPEERKLREEIRFRKKGNGILGVVLVIVLFLAVAYLLLTVIPWLTDSFKNISFTK